VLVAGFEGQFRDEELAAIAVRSAVGHGEASGAVKAEVGIKLVVKCVAWSTHSCAGRVATLNHELGNDAMEGRAVVEVFVVLDLLGCGVDPVLCTFGQANEVGYGVGRLLLVELAGDAAHRGIHHHERSVGNGQGFSCCLRRVGNVRAGGCGRLLRKDDQGRTCQATRDKG
jgi:hypothetical protein